MEKSVNKIKMSTLSIILFIIVVSLVSSISNMISPNLLIISNFFGFGGNTAPLGTLTFTFTIMTGITMLFFGFLTDKIVRKWIVLTGTLVFSVFSLFTILVPAGQYGFQVFYAITIIIGVGYGALIPSIFSLIGDMISQEDRSKGFSFFSIASLIGMVLGTGLATFAGPIDWRLSYFFIGIIGVIAGIFFLFFKEPSRLGVDYQNLIQKDAIEYTYRIKISDLKVIFKKKSNVWLIINFVDTIPTGIILFLLFAYMETYHGISSDITLILLLIILFSTLLGTIVFGFIGDKQFKKGKKRARVGLALIGNIVPIPFVFIALIIPFKSPDLFPGLLIWLLLFSIGIFINGAVNGNWYATVVDLNLPEHRGTVLATSNFFDIIGRAIGPLIGSIMADNFGFVYGMMISIFFWILIPFFWIGVWKNILPEMEFTEKVFKERLGIDSKLNEK
ncbi:MAG: MFS transporter [Promethearchaeota archaeon]